MARAIVTACAAVLVASAATALSAQMTREQAVASLRKVSANEMDPTYTTAAPTAQRLVDKALAKHPEVILMGVHAQPAGHKNVMVASNFGRIGKIGDEDDMRVIRTGKPNLEVPPAGDRFEVEFALRDKPGKIIGCVGVVFNYKAGDDKAVLVTIANKIAAEMQEQLPDSESLFQ